jgi:hypothetical protein
MSLQAHARSPPVALRTQRREGTESCPGASSRRSRRRPAAPPHTARGRFGSSRRTPSPVTGATRGAAHARHHREGGCHDDHRGTRRVTTNTADHDEHTGESRQAYLWGSVSSGRCTEDEGSQRVYAAVLRCEVWRCKPRPRPCTQTWTQTRQRHDLSYCPVHDSVSHATNATRLRHTTHSHTA